MNKIIQMEKSNDFSGNSKSETKLQSENKLMGDSGYECRYCNGKTHLLRDSRLKKKMEKKEKIKDEAYYS